MTSADTVSSNTGKSWQLTLYDQYRVAHEPVSDGVEITVSPRSLNSELMCPICLDMLRNTMTTKECLHRFCQECITTALRSGNKECPTCRKKLVSKRSLRPDPNFDALISKIYPNREEYDAMQERAFIRLSKHHNTQALQKSITEGMRFQAQIRRMNRCTHHGSSEDFEKSKRKRQKETASSTSNSNNNSSNAACNSNNNNNNNNGVGSNNNGSRPASDIESSFDFSASEASAQTSVEGRSSEIEFIMRPHPGIANLEQLPSFVKQARYIKTTVSATVDHLIKYLAMRIKLDNDNARRGSGSNVADSDYFWKLSGDSVDGEASQYQVLIAPGGNTQQLTSLPGDLTLDAVMNKYWKIKRPLEFYFRLPESLDFGSK